MTIAEYQELTGITVPTSDTTRMNAVIRRAEAKLETLLGYSLTKQNTWEELGKVQTSGLLPFPSLPVSDETLDNLTEPDDADGDIQLFRFDPLNTHLRINPAEEVYRAKIVLPINSDEFITVYDLTNVSPYLNAAGLVTAITRNDRWFTWSWWNSLLWTDRNNLHLAVEANFVNICDVKRYTDLAYLLADMVTYYADPSYSVMGNIRSESIDSHSYSRASTGKDPDSMAPEGQRSSKMIIDKYAGPSVFRKLVQ